LAHNNELLRQHESRVSRARTQTAVTLSAVGGALTLFLSVALVLAFLAIEGHSRAIRTAMESMVRLTEGHQAQESTSNNP
jgi:TctA family transporter